jgi:ppGpp synthetase/RelA/SpoT-type nucleotidyltranferase
MPVLHDPEQFNGKNLSDAPLFPNFNVIDDLDTSMHKNAAEAGESLGKKTIKHSFELDVRKGYSKDTNAFESSKLLLDNLFSELCANFDGLYAHFVRQKNIESLLNKLKLRGKSLDSYEQVKQEIKDIIGCRLIVYAPSKIVELHNVLMSYKQFSIKCVTIHSKKYSNEPVVSQIKNLCTKKNIKLIEKEPNSGYFGVHYQFINDPVHEIYKLCKVKPYEVFELQVRTLLQHTWSEIEHKCVYKESITPARDLKPSFLQLSYQLAASDMSLDDIFAATELTPSFKNTEQLDNSQSIFEPLRSKLTTILNQSDSSTSEYYPSIYNEVEQVLNSFKDNIDVLINDPNKENCIVAYDLALAILQSRHYKTALSIYKSYVGWENLGGTIYLRVAECLYGLAGVDQIKRYRAESRTYIEHIRKCIEINEYEPAEKVKLCAGTAMVEWRFGLFGNACFFSKEAINSINVDDRISLFKHRMNHCYYSLENILSIGLDLSDMNSLSKLENLKIEAENAQSHIKVKEIDSAATFDTLAWIYYYNASALNKQGKHAEALKNIIKSVEYINICKNKGVKHHSSKSIWKSHEEKINMLLGVIILDNN